MNEKFIDIEGIITKEANAVGGSISGGINNNSIKAEKAMQFSISETGSIKDMISKMKVDVHESEDFLKKMIVEGQDSLQKYKKEQKRENDFMLKKQNAQAVLAAPTGKGSKPPKNDKKGKYGKKSKSPENEDEADEKEDDKKAEKGL